MTGLIGKQLVQIEVNDLDDVNVTSLADNHVLSYDNSTSKWINGAPAAGSSYTHPNHSGEVVSSADGAQVISDNVVDEANLKISNSGTNGHFLSYQSGNAGALTWAAASGGGGGSATNLFATAGTVTHHATSLFASGDNSVNVQNRAIGIGGAIADTGFGGVVIGYDSSSNNSYSVVIGYDNDNNGGGSGSDYNVMVGCFNDMTARNSVAIGYSSSCLGSAGANYMLAIGSNAHCTHSGASCVGKDATSVSNNSFVLGGSAVTDLRCQDTSITAVSDSRDKVNIADLDIGLDVVNEIRAVQFNKNNRGLYYDEVTMLRSSKSDVQEYTFDQAGYEAGSKQNEKKEFGFISQEIMAVLPDHHEDARVVFSESENVHGFDVAHFTPGDMVPILWKAVQELSAQNTALETRIAALEAA